MHARICKRNGLNYGLVRTDIMTLRASVAGLCDNEIASAKRNLLKWYHDGKASEWPHLEAYARVVFVMAWETVLAESLFSYLKINKSGHRSVLSNESMDAIWQLHGTTFAVDRTACAFTFPRLDSQRILNMLSPSKCVVASVQCPDFVLCAAMLPCAAVCAVCRVSCAAVWLLSL